MRTIIAATAFVIAANAAASVWPPVGRVESDKGVPMNGAGMDNMPYPPPLPPVRPTNIGKGQKP